MRGTAGLPPQPELQPRQAPFGGAGLNVVYHRYLGTAAGNNGGVYRFGGRSVRGVGSQGDWISN